MVDRAATNPNARMISNSVLTGGTYNMQTTTINQGTVRDPLKILQDASSPSAFHNSGDRYDPPKCHENTRVAVLKKIMDWIIGCDPWTRDKWIMWLYGGAGAGKSAIGQTIAERCYAEGRLLASFFFGSSDGTRNHAKCLIPTIASQIYANFPETRNNISSVINTDPLIFNKSLLFQLMSLVIRPLKHLGDTVSHHLIIIDGLDECVDRASQVTILRTLFDALQKHNCRIRFLVASRPEHDIVNAFSSENVEVILAKLALDDEYQSYQDIQHFLTDKFKDIAKTHPFRKQIPKQWPGDHVVEEIAEKASGQFIYASIVVKYIESIRHRPDHRLEIVRNLRPRKSDSDLPFAELDALYTYILCSVEDPSQIMEILSFSIRYSKGSLEPFVELESLEQIHGFEPGCLQLLLCDAGALIEIVPFQDGDVMKVLHSSILDFLIDPSRSQDVYIADDLLVVKHVTNCLKFLSKNTHENPTTVSVAFALLSNNCSQVPFTKDMASAFNGFYPAKIFQDKSLHTDIKRAFLTQVNPALVKIMRRSDQHQFLLRYLTMVDETYGAILDNYDPGYLALKISILMHEQIFPTQASRLSSSFPQFCRSENDILSISTNYANRGNPAKATDHRGYLREFLLDPIRSKHHNFQNSAGKIYVTSLLTCFTYLNVVFFRYQASWDGVKLYPFTTDEEAPNLEPIFLFGSWDANGNKWQLSEEHSITKDIWDRCKPEVADIAETEKAIQAWYREWYQFFKLDEDIRLWPLIFETDTIYRKRWLAQYGLMLVYMIYFFPLACRSQELINLCKTTVLRRDLTLFPTATISAQHAMAAYVKRVEALKHDE